MSASIRDRATQLKDLLDSCEFSLGDEKLEIEKGHEQVVQLIQQARGKLANVFLIGNGGSAAIVSHAKTDLMNVGKVKAITLHESAIMTCLSNDYGYENVFSKQLQVLANPNDVLIAVSSSGQSQNILNAVDKIREKNGNVITLSGFKADNPLRHLGDMNYWINSDNYTLVEIAHLFVLHHLADCLKTNNEAYH